MGSSSKPCLLDSNGVNVKKLSVLCAFADEEHPTINTTVRAAGFDELIAVGQSIIAFKKVQAEAESLQRSCVDEVDLDQPLNSVVPTKLGG